MIGMLAPLGLAALAAMLVPLVIHLLRRPEDRVLPFAAWRYLLEPARPRERLRLRHWLLLALRLLLIAVIALLLSQLVWYRDAEPTPAMTVAWPGAAADAATPSLDPREPASALRQIDAELSPGTALTVQVPEVLDGLDAERLRLSRDVGWQIQAGGGAAAPAAALRVAVRSDDEAQRATAQAVIDAVRVAPSSSTSRTVARQSHPIPICCSNSAASSMQPNSAGCDAAAAPWSLYRAMRLVRH